jgi:transposase
MRVQHTICCGMDVHKKSVTACLMWGPADQEPQFEIRRFGTMTSELKKLSEWLKQRQCEVAAMESTGAYWKPVWNVLEGQIGLILANAKHVRSLPGEKTDNKDGKRIASFLRHGLIRSSFVPPQDIRELRDLTRYRKKLLGNGAAERNRIQKVLEDANIKLGSVLTDVFGVSGQRMLHEMVEKPVLDIDQVASLAHWRLQPKMEALKNALEGRLTPHHRFMMELSLNHMQHIEQQILRLDEEIARHLEPYDKQYQLLQTIPGIAGNAAASILAEIGPDVSAFPDDSHLASWSGICPGNNESAGKKFSTKTRKGNAHLVSTLVESGWGAARTNGSQFKARYHRVKTRRGSQRAIVAVGHSLLRTVFVVLKTGKPYEEPMRPILNENQRRRKAQRLARELRHLGFEVALEAKEQGA